MILICIVPLAGYVALQFPSLQNRIAKRLVSSMEQRIDGRIEMDRVAIVLINKVMVYGISITGEYGDTLAAVDKLSVSLSPSELLRGRISIDRLFLENGCFNLSKEENGNNINRIFRTVPKPDSLSTPFRFPDMTVAEVILRNMSFSLTDRAADTASRDPRCMNFSNLEINNINARINRVEIVDNTISCRIRRLSGTDRCGYSLRSLSGNFFLGPEESRLDNLHLTDNWSEIRAEYLSFGYDSGKDLNDFVNKINLRALFRNSTLDFRSIGVFAPGLRDSDLKVGLSGEVSGPVAQLSTHDLEVFSGKNTSARLSAVITGLPDIYDTHFNVTIKRISTTSGELSGIISKFSHKENGIGRIIPDTEVALTGIAYGKLSNLYSIGSLSSGIGSISYDAELKGREHHLGDSLSANLWVDTLSLGSILNSDRIGDVSLNTRILARLPVSGNSRLAARLENMDISSMVVNGYRYNGISMTGEYIDSTANLRLISRDRAFPTIFQGIVDFNNRRKYGVSRIRLYMDTPEADLMDMNLVKTGTMASAGVTAMADLRFTGHNVLGKIMLEDISYANDNGRYHLDSISVRSVLSETRHRVTLRSPVLHAGYLSTDSPARLADRLKLALSCPALDSLLSIDTAMTATENGYYDFHLRTFDLSKICDILKPGLHIADSTTVDLTLNRDNILDFKVQSSKIAMRKPNGNGLIFNDLLLKAGNSGPQASGILSADRIRIGGMTMDKARVSLEENGDSLVLRAGYNNADTTYMDISAAISAWKDSEGAMLADISIDSSSLNIRNHIWTLAPASVLVRPRNYSVSGFRLYSGDDAVSIEGSISEDPESVLAVNMNNMDLDLLNSFTPKNLNIQGKISGEMELFNFFTTMGATMSIEGTDLSIGKEKVGRLTVMSRRDLARNRFNVLVNNYIGNSNPINLSGYFVPGQKFLSLRLSLSRFQLRTVNPFISGIADIAGGCLSGDIDISGMTDRLSINSSNTGIDSLKITAAYNKVPYIINGPIDLSRHRINLKSLTIEDPHGSKAVLNGSMSHDFFKDLYLDADLRFNDFQVLNTQERDNSKFYGSAYASGMVGISGFTDDLQVNAQVTTGDNTSLHIPMSSSSSASTSDLISFTDFRHHGNGSGTQEDEMEEETGKRHTRSNIEVKATAGITQGTELFIEMNKQLGDVLRCSGNGNVSLTLNPSRNLFDVRGDYTISEGDYHFVLSIQSKDFIIDEGGTISFNGDFRNTMLNVGATYRTKASISTLIADTTSVGNRRNVDCGIQLQGPLTNPELTFSIDIPDLDPITKGRVESALSTPDKIQKQFMALLISGSFVPDEQSGIINNSTILYSNASEILSNQFNNIFRQLDIPLDLGLNYQPGSTNGSWGMFDVAISYQAFNNRLIINGNVGNRETSSNWAGDFDAEIKVDRQGKLRITLFTRSVDSYSNYLDNTQRSGFGITYQDEFDTFGDFWRNIFYSRKRKEQYELEQLRQAEEELRKEAEEAQLLQPSR